MMDAYVPDLLETIVAATRRSVAVRQAQTSRDRLERSAERTSPNGAGFLAAVAMAGRLNVIAECKRRSPSRGILRDDYDAATIAASYERAGAIAVSVLTESTFFDGALADLRAVRQAVSLPVLRKDFIVSDYQIVEARAAGADAVLLIVAALADAELTRLLQQSAAAGLAALVEVHDAAELSRAIDAGAQIVGVNARNLRTLDVRLEVAEELIEVVPSGLTTVAESGLTTREDLERLHGTGYDAFLIGEKLMTAEDPGEALRMLLADHREPGRPSDHS